MHPHIPWKIQTWIQKWKTVEEEKIGVNSPARSTLGVEGCVGAPGWGLWQMTSESIIHMNLQNQTTSWLMCGWNTFSARMSHGHTQTHKTHHNPDLGEATTFPLIVFFVLSHEACAQMSFCPRTPKLKFPKFLNLRLSWFWRPILFCTNLRLRWGLKQSCYPCRELSNDMLHAIYMQVNHDNSQLLMVGNQIGSLTFSLSFNHNLCFKYSNGMCKPILNIYVPRTSNGI
jgi:hypothetical protein